MLVKLTRGRRGATRSRTVNEPAVVDPVEQFKQQVQQALDRYRNRPQIPQNFLELEKTLKDVSGEACRQLLEQETNRLEPADKKAMPTKVYYGGQRYRINKRTVAKVTTSFGTITVCSFYYLNEEPGEPGLHPLLIRLGIAAGKATPVLLERVARMSVDHTQNEVRAWLLREHGVHWSNQRLRSAVCGHRDAMLEFVADLQEARLLEWLRQAEKSRGRNRPILAVGRDGVMIPMQSGYREASTATLSVYNRQKKRLGTIYLGQMPEENQVALTKALTALLNATLKSWQGPVPRLAYITDKGTAPDKYYRTVLKKMKHPRDGKALAWEWVLDFWHVASYIGKMADCLFGPGTAVGAKWFAKMRSWLRDRVQGASHVARSAMQHLEQRRMTKAQKKTYWEAYNYLRRHRRMMDYVGYRRRGLPIGSGVTEAACKTLFAQRFKRSGMRWQRDSGQVILDLRSTYLSGIWDEVFDAELAARQLPSPDKRGSHREYATTSCRRAA